MQFKSTTDAEKLDRIVARALGASRREARMLIAGGKVSVNDRVVKILIKPIKAGSSIAIDANSAAPPLNLPQNASHFRREAHRSNASNMTGEERNSTRPARGDRRTSATARSPRTATATGEQNKYSDRAENSTGPARGDRRTSAAARSPRTATATGEQNKYSDRTKLTMDAILHLDKWIIALNKPAGLLSETDRLGSPSIESVVPKLLRAKKEKDLRLWLVHRLDAGTSGVILMARKPSISGDLGDLFRRGNIEKTYIALVKGQFTQRQVVNAPIDRIKGTQQGISANGKTAITEFEPISVGDGVSLVLARPKTGRTHQIRVHLAHLGFPILGDRLYRGPGYQPDGQPIGRPMLHALQIVFVHPATHKKLIIKADVPEDFTALARAMRVSINLMS
jgi:23S rRNA pseudouridine1911/1915/1917 synthase